MLFFIRNVELSFKVKDEFVCLVNTQVQHKVEMHGNEDDQEGGEVGGVEARLACEVADTLGKPADGY